MKVLRALIIISLAAILLCGCIPIDRFYKATPTITPSPEPSQTPIIEPPQEPDTTPTPFPLTRFFNKPEIDPENVWIVIEKSNNILKLYGDDIQIGAFPCATGAVEGAKKASGDKKTPEGEYYICSKGKGATYDKFLGISYPNKVDAKNAYDESRISRAEYNSITKAIDKGKRPPASTALGGGIGIYAADITSTEGGIAVKQEDILILWEYVDIGTKVVIEP